MKLQRLLSAVTAAGLTLGMLTAPQHTAAEDTKLRVMPLGDSITDGFTQDPVGGYRKTLWYQLQENGYVEGIDFVGPNGWYIDGVMDYNHAGYSGYTIADCPGRKGIYNFIDELMTEYPADVVLLQIGTNDIISSYELDHAGERLELLVDSVLSYIPEGGMLYLSTIPYMDADVTTYTDAYTAEEMDQAVDDYNAKVRAVVEKKQAAGQPITLADVNSVLTKADLLDGVHPSAQGYEKMGHYWYGVLTSYIDRTPAPTEPATETETEPATEPETEPETAPPTQPQTEDYWSWVTKGNVQYDEAVDVLDIIRMQKYLLGALDEPLFSLYIAPGSDAAAMRCADLNDDGEVDVFDLGYLKRLVLAAA